MLEMFLSLVVVFKSSFSKNNFRITDYCVGPDLDPNCLQRASGDNTIRQNLPNNILLFECLSLEYKILAFHKEFQL